MLTLHHLETSRSTRIIWLLEALGADYKLVTHKRGPDRRAMADLEEIHPLGKAPVIVDGNLVLVESATILRFIVERYGAGRFTLPAGTDARAKHDELLDYAESSLMPPLMTKVLGGVTGGLSAALEQFVSVGLDKSLTYLETSIGNGPFLMGGELTIADMQMSYCLAMASIAGLLRDRPALSAYWERLQTEPGFRRALELGGPMMPAWR